MTKNNIQDTQQKNYLKFNNTNYIKDYIKKSFVIFISTQYVIQLIYFSKITDFPTIYNTLNKKKYFQ